ncbi:hypothetical protein EV426DRAFT_574028 [Tirmania nivea]|nr:hypothetical protein EV426DRAFT_574028 [Tirmania nivea]
MVHAPHGLLGFMILLIWDLLIVLDSYTKIVRSRDLMHVISMFSEERGDFERAELESGELERRELERSELERGASPSPPLIRIRFVYEDFGGFRQITSRSQSGECTVYAEAGIGTKFLA